MTFGENAVKVLTLIFGYDIYQLSPELSLRAEVALGLSGRDQKGVIMTALTILVISLFILTPLSVVLAVVNDSGIGVVAGIIVTVFTHVIFWVMFGELMEDYEVFSMAGIYEFGTVVGVLGIAWNALDISLS